MNIGNNKTIIYTNNAPEPIGAYSQAVRAGNLIFISGQIAIDPVSNLVVTTAIADEVAQVFANISNICQASGANLDNIIKLTLYLTDMANFKIINDFMAKKFTKPYPARSVVAVTRLPKDVNFAAEAIVELC